MMVVGWDDQERHISEVILFLQKEQVSIAARLEEQKQALKEAESQLDADVSLEEVDLAIDSFVLAV